MSMSIPMAYNKADVAIHLVISLELTFSKRIMVPPRKAPKPTNNIPARPLIALALDGAILNCSIRYFGKNVKNPAIGRMCNIPLSMRNNSNLFLIKRDSEPDRFIVDCCLVVVVVIVVLDGVVVVVVVVEVVVGDDDDDDVDEDE